MDMFIEQNAVHMIFAMRARRLFEKCEHLLSAHTRIILEEVFDRIATLQEIDQRITGTRVPPRTGVPPRISGSE